MNQSLLANAIVLHVNCKSIDPPTKWCKRNSVFCSLSLTDIGIRADLKKIVCQIEFFVNPRYQHLNVIPQNESDGKGHSKVIIQHLLMLHYLGG